MCTAQAFPRTIPHASPPRARASYQVARRPLEGMGLLYPYSSPFPGSRIRSEHQQFIGSDGRNFGFLGPVGVGADPGHIREYTFDIPDYGRTKYDAECIDLAREEADRDWAKVRETAEEMARLHPDFPQDMDDSWRYNLIADNCQDYVADVLKRAEAIARKKGVPLIVE